MRHFQLFLLLLNFLFPFPLCCFECNDSSVLLSREVRNAPEGVVGAQAVKEQDGWSRQAVKTCEAIPVEHDPLEGKFCG